MRRFEDEDAKATFAPSMRELFIGDFELHYDASVGQ
jgi:hypothetical protein